MIRGFNFIGTFIIISFCLLILIVGCGGSKGVPSQLPEIQFPEWFRNPPEDPNYIYAAAMAESRDLVLVTDMAELRGMSRIASMIEMRISRLLETVREEVGVKEDPELKAASASFAKAAASSEVKGARIAKQEVMKAGYFYYSFVLMEVPIRRVNTALMEKIAADEDTYFRFRSSQAFKELEEEVKKYEESRKEKE